MDADTEKKIAELTARVESAQQEALLNGLGTQLALVAISALRRNGLLVDAEVQSIDDALARYAGYFPASRNQAISDLIESYGHLWAANKPAQ